MKIDKRKFLINSILISIIIICFVWILLERIEENKIEKNIIEVQQQNEKEIEQNNLKENINSEKSEEKQEEISENKEKPEEEQSESLESTTEGKKEQKILQIYRGYDVCAKLSIPTISLETYILSNYSNNALNISPTKFWGVEPNQTGSFCIAGHNFNSKNMFKKLKNLKIGDTFYITDNYVGQLEYKIFKTDIVLPSDTSCLDAQTKNEKEVTLITCTSDSKKRIIVKAKEIK